VKKSVPRNCSSCVFYQRRAADWSLCNRPSWRKYVYAEDERKSILPWKCGANGRYHKESP